MQNRSSHEAELDSNPNKFRGDWSAVGGFSVELLLSFTTKPSRQIPCIITWGRDLRLGICCWRFSWKWPQTNTYTWLRPGKVIRKGHMCERSYAIITHERRFSCSVFCGSEQGRTFPHRWHTDKANCFDFPCFKTNSGWVSAGLGLVNRMTFVS